MIKKILFLFYIAAGITAYPTDISCNDNASKSALVGLMDEGHFSTPDGKLILYRGIGSADSTMGREQADAPAEREMYKWLQPGGFAAGMAADNDKAAFSFTVSLAYAGRYTGVQAWDSDRGIIRVEIPWDLLRSGRAMQGEPEASPVYPWSVMCDTPVSVSTDRDAYDGLPFIGTAFSGWDGGVRTLCFPVLGSDGNCPALEVRLTIGTLKKLEPYFSVRRVTWAEYDAARKLLLSRKGEAMKKTGMAGADGAIRGAAGLWAAEAALYSSLCGAGGGICPEAAVDRASVCARLLALPENHYLFRLSPGRAESRLMLGLIDKKTGFAFRGRSMAEIKAECAN